jgi:large subunit ribosomal protein L30
MAKQEKIIRVTQTKSSIGRLEKHKACLTGLGLRRVGHSVDVVDTDANRGMVNKVAYMLRVEEAS